MQPQPGGVAKLAAEWKEMPKKDSGNLTTTPSVFVPVEELQKLAQRQASTWEGR